MVLSHTHKGLYIPRVESLSVSPVKALDRGLIDPYRGQKTSIEILVRLILSLHSQLEYTPYFEEIVYRVKFRELARSYDLDDIRNAIILAAKGCKAGFGIQAIKAHLNPAKTEKIEVTDNVDPDDLFKEYGLL